MSDSGLRITDGVRPEEKALTEWLGPEGSARWAEVLRFIEGTYPGVFTPEWLYGGKKHGWSLRFKKSRSFCTLVPERDRMLVLVVLGAAERAGVEAILGELTDPTRALYEGATTYHDGKWLLLPVDSDDTFGDLKRLLGIKRKPRKKQRAE